MAEARSKRRLAAILAADVVGFSRLMEQDEAGTLARLKALRREVLEPAVSRNDGRIFKVMGDGVLVEFDSAVHAVECAIELQRAMAGTNDGVPTDRHILLRIGVNLGDIVIEGADRYGDGINIAARLESIAEPGGILVSGAVHDHARNKVEASFEDLGPQGLKNIAEPVRVVRVTGTPGPQVHAMAQPTDKPSIAVLPFVNMSGDPQEDYFSDGITEDIITELSRFRSLLVIARNSSFQYRGRAVDIRRVGRELAVRYVVEGSVRRAGARIRVTAQLIDAETGSHLWADRYDRDLEDVFELQDDITRAIVGVLPRRLEEAALERAGRKAATSLTAYVHLLRAEWLWYRDAGHEEVLALLGKAVELDPGYARAYARMALIYGYLRASGDPSDELTEPARRFAARAAELGDGDARVHAQIAASHLFCGRHDLAEVHSERAVTLNPNDAEAVYRRGLTLTYGGAPEAGLDWFARALRLDPNMPQGYLEALFDAHYMAGEYGKALDIYRRWSNPQPYMVVEAAACFAQSNRLDELRTCVREFTKSRPESFDLAAFIRAQMAMCRRPEDREHWLEGYRKAGLLA